MSKKHKKVCAALNYIAQFLVLASVVTGCISISAVASLVGIPIGITSSVVGVKICAITAAIEQYKSRIKKKKKKHDKIVWLAKTKLITLDVFISRALSDSVN